MRATVSRAYLSLDVEGSTTLHQLYPSQMTHTILRYRQIIREIAAPSQCLESRQLAGDGGILFFETVADAFQVAVAAMRAFHVEPWALSSEPFRVRMAIHCGEPTREIVDGEDTDYIGGNIELAARLQSAGHGGQLLLSDAAVLVLAGDSRTFVLSQEQHHPLHDCGIIQLPSIFRPVHVYRAEVIGVPNITTPPKSFHMRDLERPKQFIGREQELADLRAKLNRYQLITLCAIGGEGKTCLAVRLAEEVETQYKDGFEFVDLTTLPEGSAQVAQTLAQALGIPLPRQTKAEGNDPLVDEICKFLVSRTMLLVLDNCEHVIEEVRRIVQRIRNTCRTVTLLATSRIPLGLHGEEAYELRGMGLPEPGASFAEIQASPAVQLFCETAHGSQFCLEAENADRVVRICRKLDGLAIAIEIAAALCEFYSLYDIETCLNEPLPSIPGRDDRFASMECVLESSYKRLPLPTQKIFRQMSLLLGANTDATVVAVCGAPRSALNRHDPDNPFVVLVRHRLLEVVKSDNASTRYKLREPVRQYAKSLLFPRELKALELRFLKYWVNFAEDNAAAMRTPHYADAKEAFAEAYDSLRAAWEQKRDPVFCLQLAAAMPRYWCGGHLTEGIATLRDALQNAPNAPCELQARALTGLGDLLCRHGEPACEVLMQGLALWEQTGNPLGIADTLLIMSYVPVQEGQILPEERIERAFRLYGDANYPWGQGACYAAWGSQAYSRQHYEESRANFQQAQQIFRQQNDSFRLANLSCNLAIIDQKAGRHLTAEHLLSEAIALFGRLRETHIAAFNRNNLAVSQCALERYGDAAQSAFVSLKELKALDDHCGTLIPLLTLSDIASKSGNCEETAQILGILDQQQQEHGTLPQSMKGDYAQILQDAATSLGQEAFAWFYEMGCAYSWNQNLTFLEKFVHSLAGGSNA